MDLTTTSKTPTEAAKLSRPVSAQTPSVVKMNAKPRQEMVLASALRFANPRH